MSHQLPFPPDTELGGVPVTVYRQIVAGLIELCAAPHGSSLPAVVSQRELAVVLGDLRDVEPAQACIALSALAIDKNNAGWHAETLAGPLPALVRLDGEHLAVLRQGLLTEPLFFLARELRRRDADAYHNASRARETVLRADLAALFADARYAGSVAPIVLRTKDRRNRTDIDAALFDRKTGTLAVFELKSQDPFARSAAERGRQQEAMRQAGAQMAAVLGWIGREGADAVLARMDAPTAKRFRVHRVLPFVLGRYTADGGDGARRDRRVAWSAWPDFVRLVQQATSGNPLLSVHSALCGAREESLAAWADLPPVEIQLGAVSLEIHGSAESARSSRTDRQ